MTWKLEIRNEADAEIFEAYNWYESQKAGLGDRFINEFESVLQKITTTPHHYKIAKSIFRQASLKSFPFVIYFEIADATIIVYSVFHTSRNPSKILRRIK